MATGIKVDLAGNDLAINNLYTGASTPGAVGTQVFNGTALANTTLTFPAGTTTLAPETFTAGTNLTTATAGSVEFDGKVFYDTAVASARQLRNDEQFIRQVGDSGAANNTGLDTANAAAVFVSPANGSVTLTTGSAYYFEAQYLLTNTGTTSHTWSTLFAGTAVLNTIAYAGFGISTTAANTPASGGLTGFVNVATAVPFTAASTSATEQVVIQLYGIVNVTTGGTFIPQMKASARPGASGTPGVIVKDGSFFRVWGLGANATASVGNWS